MYVLVFKAGLKLSLLQAQMNTLIEALRQGGTGDRGVLGREWDRSMEVELSELQRPKRSRHGHVSHLNF